MDSSKAERITQINRACCITRKRAEKQYKENRKSYCMDSGYIKDTKVGFFENCTFGRG